MRSLRKVDSHVSRPGQRPLRRERTMLVFAAAVATGVVLLAGAVAATAGHIASKRREAQAIVAQVAQLDAELGDAAERWNGANYRLAQISEQLKATRKD